MATTFPGPGGDSLTVMGSDAAHDPGAGLQVYRVGGAVRDALLGWPVKDTDWVVVGATEEEMRRRGFRAVGRDFPVFLHPHTQEEFALARTERKSGHGYTGFVVHASPDVTLEEDLERRDLTINAMAQAPDGRLVDPFQGQADLDARRLRHVSQAFVEDPLRVLRTARFLARYAGLDFRIAADTMALMSELAASGELAHLVAERVWTETEKALGEPSPAIYFQALDDCDGLAILMPELVSEEHPLTELLPRMQQLPQGLENLSVWRWARLVEALDPVQRSRLAERLKLPRLYRDAGELLARTRTLSRHTSPDAEAVMAWLNGIDAWRRSERVAALLSILALDDSALAWRVEAGWWAASAIQARTLVEEGFTGGALGQELERRRYQALARALKQTD